MKTRKLTVLAHRRKQTRVNVISKICRDCWSMSRFYFHLYVKY